MVATVPANSRPAFYQPALSGQVDGYLSGLASDRYGEVVTGVADIGQCIYIILSTPKGSELLARAVALHRHKGTPWAIREALKAVGFNDLEIDERLPSNRYDGALTFSGSDVYAAYLVAAEIGGTDTLKELRMLFAAHGIGFIKLDVENPADSQVLIPARERDEIDWDMANRLATENRDFLEYVKLVKQFYQTGEARPADWDVPELDD